MISKGICGFLSFIWGPTFLPRPWRLATCIFATKIHPISELTENPRSVRIPSGAVATFCPQLKVKRDLASARNFLLITGLNKNPWRWELHLQRRCAAAYSGLQKVVIEFMRSPNSFCKITHIVDGRITEVWIKDDSPHWRRHQCDSLIIR